MKTLAEIKEYVQTMYNDTSSKTGLRINSFLVIAFRSVKRMIKTKWVNVVTQSITSVASQQTYALDARFSRLVGITMTVNGTPYRPPLEVSSLQQWNELNSDANSVTKSDYPQYFIIKNGQISLWPTPSGTATVLTLEFRSNARSFVPSDFTDKSAGTVSVTANGTGVTGSGTSFAATDVGRYIRFDATGDWYKIAGYSSSTAITLDKPFSGSSISGGTYLLGTTLEDLPDDVAEVVAHIILSKLFYLREDRALGREYAASAQELVKEIIGDINNNSMMPMVNVIDDGYVGANPNDYPMNLTG